MPNRFFFRKENTLDDARLAALKTGILSSEYLGPSPLGKEFIRSKGFSVVFQRAYVEEVAERFPYLAPLFDAVLFESSNAFYLNPLVLEGSSKVEPHIDCRLLAEPNLRLIPNLVSVLYVDMALDIEGGYLILNCGHDNEISLRPQTNEVIHFLGSIVHSVSEIESASRRISVVCEQYNLSDELLERFPAFTVITDSDIAPRVA
jgi:hypothetical protein